MVRRVGHGMVLYGMAWYGGFEVCCSVSFAYAGDLACRCSFVIRVRAYACVSFMQTYLDLSECRFRYLHWII